MLAICRLTFVVLLALPPSSAFASLPNLRAHDVHITYKQHRGTFAAKDFEYKLTDERFLQEDSLRADLAVSNKKVQLKHKGSVYQLGDFLNFLDSCDATTLTKVSYDVSPTGAILRVPQASRLCPNATLSMQGIAVDCTLKGQTSDEPSATLLAACLAEETRIKMAQYQSLMHAKPSWLARPFVPKAVTDIDVKIEKNRLQVSFGLETPLVNTRAELGGTIYYQPEADSLRLDINTVRIGGISGSKLISIIAGMFDKNTVQYQQQGNNHRFVIKLSQM